MTVTVTGVTIIYNYSLCCKSSIIHRVHYCCLAIIPKYRPVMAEVQDVFAVLMLTGTTTKEGDGYLHSFIFCSDTEYDEFLKL